MKKTERKVFEWIKRHQMWSPTDTVILAVSGGVDSMVMLHILATNVGVHKGQLKVVTIDHGLRAGSVNECQHVLATAEKLSVPAELVSLNLSDGPNLQERAREARQEALKDYATDRIATAHHIDDQAETMLYRLLRGSGPIGLSALSPVTPPWCRPMLCLSRQEIDAYAVWKGFKWFEDPSNSDSLRGKIRQILPMLTGLHGSQSATLARSAQICAYEDAFLSGVIDLEWDKIFLNGVLKTRPLKALHPALQLRILHRFCRLKDLSLRFETLERVVLILERDQFSKSIQLSSSHYLHITPNTITAKAYDKKHC